MRDTAIEFFDKAIHTDKDEVHELRDMTAAQFLIKMCAMDATVRFSFGPGQEIYADTPRGQYWFVFGAEGDDELYVEQVL